MRPSSITLNQERIGKQSKAGDRRTRLRLTCKGSANIRFHPAGPDVAGSIEDLSAGGCSIKSDFAISASKLHSQIEVRLDVQRHKLSLCGILCHVKDECRLGIEFVQVNEYRAEQIQRLMADLRF